MAPRESTREDYTWVGTDEPHYSRREQILKAHPEIEKLYGPDIRLLPAILALVAIQLTLAVYVRDASWVVYVLVAWVIGGTISHSLSLANHELSHNLCFEEVLPNEILGFIANLAQGLPSAITFKKYHLEHHRAQGYDVIDVDIPTRFEARFFSSTLGKFMFVFCQPLFYALRPMIINPKNPTLKEGLNWVSAITFDLAFYYYFGGSALGYLFLSTWLGLGLHPISGHFISEHYEFVKGAETYSYYGPLNYLTWNVGYHNEHHDFPRISGFRLPEVRRIAHEFYDNLPQHASWPMVLWYYIIDPKMSPYSRVKRFPTDPTIAKKYNIPTAKKAK
eukprot:TRINITY_DN2310_c0_g3_i1.p1 TRINITY_DN2310_c0_g3~~TRINITY_DN2310_c0_g3_i1.p1  ORF type:complete len:360 (+),score=136.25 TRINITY_DN2310_c0_g3_i1:80-1081(+)